MKPFKSSTGRSYRLLHKFSPKELLLSLIINTNPTPLEMSSSMPTPDDFNTHMVYMAQQRPDGYSEAIQHAMNQKTRFDRKILESEEGEEIFTKVQVYQNDLAKTIGSERKLALMWLESSNDC
jgi:hypothetical protein